MEDQKQPTPLKIDNVDTGFAKFIMTFVLLVILFVITFSISYFSNSLKPKSNVTSFSECEMTKDSVVQESYPRICRLPDGKTFTEDVSREEVKELESENEIPVKKCVTGGCNNEICQDVEEEPRASICIYREEFECYKSGICEVQKSGNCGWTVTNELVSCLNRIK